MASRFDYTSEFNDEYPETGFTKIDVERELDGDTKGAFGLVTSLGVLHWQKHEDQPKVVQRLADLLEEGSPCILQANYKQDKQMPIEQAVYGAAKKMKLPLNPDSSGFYLSKIDCIKEMFENAGFEVRQCAKSEIKTVFPSKEAFSAFLQNVLENKKALKAVQKNMQKALFSNVIEEYEELVPPAEDGKYAYGVDCVSILAFKKYTEKQLLLWVVSYPFFSTTSR